MRKTPTLKETHTEEREWQDRLETQEHNDCNQDHSATGMCPCCGVELDDEILGHGWDFVEGNDLEASQQICPSCGWQSSIFYDA